MRECIYCGRQLEKGEQCTCAMSVAKRRERERREQAERPKTKAEIKAEQKGKKRQEKQRVKSEKIREKAARENARRASTYSAGINKGAFSNVWRLFKNFIKSPIETIMNPGEMSVTEIMIFVIFEGFIAGLCTYSVVTGASRGSLRLLGNLLGFNGMNGYNYVVGWIISAISGAVGGIVTFLLYTGIFYFINKWIFKQFTPYWEFSKRFVFAAIPFTIIGAIGVLLGLFSQTTFAVLLICGGAGMVILTYEILRSMWYSKSASKTMYAMMAGLLIFMMIALYIVRISAI